MNLNFRLDDIDLSLKLLHSFTMFPTIFVFLSLFLVWYLLSIIFSVLQLKECSSKYSMFAVSQAIISASHGLFIALVGFNGMYECRADVIWARSPQIAYYLFVSKAYFLYDLIVMYYCFLLKSGKAWSFKSILSFVKSRPLMIAHHVVILGAFLPFFTSNEKAWNFIGAAFLAMETSTVFVNIRFVMNKVGMTSKLPYQINGILLVVTFGVFRVLVFPYLYLVYSIQECKGQDQTVFKALSKVPLTCHVGSLILFAPQVYWFCLILKRSNEVMSKKEN